MKLFSTIVIFAGLLFICRSVRAQATVEGKVKLPKAHSADVMSKRYDMSSEPVVIAPDPPCAVVYLDGTFSAPKTPFRAQMGQKNFEFMTPLLPVLAGTTVEFPNYDDTYHNIFSYSKPKRFDLGRYRGDEKPVPSQVFDKPGVVMLHCDIHEHMRAIILVLETPHFQLTTLEGNYKLTNLPTGHYKLKAWIDGKTTLEHEVDLKPGSTVHVDFP